MENASKALIIAAEIMIGVLLLTILVVAFRAYGNFSDVINQNIETKTASEFNTKFEIYNGRKDLTAQDVITIGNLAKEYNGTEGARMTIVVVVSGVEAKYTNIHQLSDEETYKFIDQYSLKNKTYFECQKIQYNETAKRVDKVWLKKR